MHALKRKSGPNYTMWHGMLTLGKKALFNTCNRKFFNTVWQDVSKKLNLLGNTKVCCIRPLSLGLLSAAIACINVTTHLLRFSRLWKAQSIAPHHTTSLRQKGIFPKRMGPMPEAYMYIHRKWLNMWKCKQNSVSKSIKGRWRMIQFTVD